MKKKYIEDDLEERERYTKEDYDEVIDMYFPNADSEEIDEELGDILDKY